MLLLLSACGFTLPSAPAPTEDPGTAAPSTVSPPPSSDLPTSSAPDLGAFPVGRYVLAIEPADDPPLPNWRFATFEIDFRTDGTYLMYGGLDTKGEYRVEGPRLELHLDTACRNDRQVGFYEWRTIADALAFDLGERGDPCSQRSWLFTLRPWQRVGP